MKIHNISALYFPEKGNLGLNANVLFLTLFHSVHIVTELRKALAGIWHLSEWRQTLNNEAGMVKYWTRPKYSRRVQRSTTQLLLHPGQLHKEAWWDPLGDRMAEQRQREKEGVENTEAIISHVLMYLLLPNYPASRFFFNWVALR